MSVAEVRTSSFAMVLSLVADASIMELREFPFTDTSIEEMRKMWLPMPESMVLHRHRQMLVHVRIPGSRSGMARVPVSRPSPEGPTAPSPRRLGA